MTEPNPPGSVDPALSDDHPAAGVEPDDDGVEAALGNGSTRRAAVRNVIEWIVILGVALLVAGLARAFLIQAFYIPSASMVPRLEIGDRVLVNKLSYRLHDVNRGDLIVFDRPDCDQSDPEIEDLIKRVVALGGETVQGRNGSVWVDGEELAEPYLPSEVSTSDFGPVEVPDGSVWVMGDNRANSKDSRILCGGPTPIAEEAIQGRAFVVIWPLSSFKGL